MKATEEDFSNFSISFSHWRVGSWEMEGKANEEKNKQQNLSKNKFILLFKWDISNGYLKLFLLSVLDKITVNS